MRHLRPVVLTLAVLLPTAAPALTDASAQSADPQSTDAVRPGNGVTIPRLIKEVKPKYTAEAMNARVQGVVWLECVVETDGTIRRVRIVRSLDQHFGLDQAAIDAAKQWMFEPGTKDGRPVPVLVTIELKFTLRDSPSEPAPLGLPEAFATTGQQESAAESGWEKLQIESSSLIVGVVHPSGWQRVLLETPGVLFSFQTSDPSLGASMFTPRPATSSRPELASTAELQKFGVGMAAVFKRQLVSVGQVRLANQLWFWYDLGMMDIPSAPVRSVTSGVPLPVRTRMWMFSTVAEGQQVDVTFVIGHRAGTDQKDWEAEARRAGPTFAKILERLSFTRAK